MRSSPPYFWAAGTGYLCFVVYGSLVPLDFQAMSWEQAAREFSEIPYLNLGIGSLADWVANLLLFIPLSFIWLGIVWPRFNLPAQVLVSLLMQASCAALAVGIEFTQVFFPQRTVSINDILAETVGAGGGIVAWWAFGERFVFWLRQWSQTRGQVGTALRLLQGYGAFLFFYNVMPLDLTLSPVELFHKWNEGRIILVPFGAHFSNAFELAYNLAVDVLIWSPVAFLLVSSGTKQPYAAMAWSAGCAALLEFFQLFVYSRVTDITDIVLAVPGSALGAFAAVRGGLPAPPGWACAKSSWLPAAGFLAWCAVLAGVFWYPFDFHSDGTTLKMRLAALHWVPFYSYYYGSEFRALTEVFHKVAFFLPLGVIARVFADTLRGSTPGRLLDYGAVLLIAAAAFGIELGQLFVPGKVADVTDFLLETAGGVMGYQGFRRVQEKARARGAAPTFRAHHAAPLPGRRSLAAVAGLLRGGPPWRMLAGGVVLLAVLAWSALHSSAAPYNVRELLNPDHPLLGVLLLSLSVFWTLGLPAAVAYWLSRPRAAVGGYPLALLGHALGAWVMVAVFAPTESIHDIVGSPVLEWPWQFETAGRFLALFCAGSLTMTWAAFAVMASVYQGSVAPGFAALAATSAAAYPLLYWIVVAEAATDNLTELMADGGTPLSAALLAAALALLAMPGTWLATRLHLGAAGRLWPGLAWALLSCPAAYWMVSRGTEGAIVKYDQVFSALQFLLSPDRSNYLQGWDLLQRYLIAHAAVVVMVMLVQFAVIRNFLLSPRRRPRRT